MIIYVDQNAGTGGDGSKEHPFKNISDAPRKDGTGIVFYTDYFGKSRPVKPTAGPIEDGKEEEAVR